MNQQSSFSKKSIPPVAPPPPPASNGPGAMNALLFMVFIVGAVFLFGSWRYNDSPAQFLDRCRRALISTADQTPTEILNHVKRVLGKLVGSDVSLTQSHDSSMHDSYQSDAQSEPKSANVDKEVQQSGVQNTQSNQEDPESIVPLTQVGSLQKQQSTPVKAPSSVFGERLGSPSDDAPTADSNAPR